MITALIQLNSKDNISENLQQCEHWIKKAAAQNAKFILLPENFSYLGNENQKLQITKTIQTESENFLKTTAKKFGIFLLGGGYAATSTDPKRVYNQSLLVNPDGHEIATYQKIHLFDVNIPGKAEFLESQTTLAGNKTITAQVENFNVGLSICYDVRFPELYQNLRKAGAHILTVPAAFTHHTGTLHWETLLRARAIENQCYVLAPTQTGVHSPTRHSYGHALIIDPLGKVLADANTEPGIITAEIDFNLIESVRKTMPVFTHKKDFL